MAAVAPNNKAILEEIKNSSLKDAKKTFNDWAKTYEEVCYILFRKIKEAILVV